jgi:uncharacterized membrane protein YeaQ/YmgE (transglycosylase-associated protein family)
MGILWVIIVGAIAGWLAGLVVKGVGFGLIGNIIVGILGAFVAGYLFPQLALMLGGGTLGIILASAAGAVVLLVIVGLIRRVV